MPIGLAAVIALFTILWRAPPAVRNSSIVDIWWGPAILLIGITSCLTTEAVVSRGRLTVALIGY